MKRGKRYEFSIFLVIQVCRLVCLLSANLKKVQKTLLLTFDFIWF